VNGVVAAVISSALGGSAAALTRYAIGASDPVTLAAFRFGIGFLLILPLALAAGVAELCRGGRFIYAAAGGLAFAAVMGPTVFIQPLSLTSLLLASYGMASIGMDGEMRRSGGFEAK